MTGIGITKVVILRDVPFGVYWIVGADAVWSVVNGLGSKSIVQVIVDRELDQCTQLPKR